MTSNNQEIRRLGEADAAPEGRQSPHQQSIFRRHDLSEVDLALYNEMKGTRDVLSDSLSGIGFRLFCTNVVSVLEKLRSTVRRGDIDMLMLEANRQSRAFYNLVHEIRNDKLGRDPFLVISIVTWRADKALIQAFLKAGADDVIVMPASVSFASERVENLIDSRREFVVITGYLGPDRRSKSRITNDELGTFAVPNGLRYKTTGDESAKPSAASLRQANRIVEEHRLRRMTLRLEQLAAQGERFASDQPGAPLPNTPLMEFLDLAEDIENRSRCADPSVTELTASMGGIMQAIVSGSSGSADMFTLLKVHGQALLSLQRGDKGAIELVVRAVKTAE